MKLEETPQLVLITFEDSVNVEHQKVFDYIFDEKRLNPNGCPFLRRSNLATSKHLCGTWQLSYRELVEDREARDVLEGICKYLQTLGPWTQSIGMASMLDEYVYKLIVLIIIIKE